jgi:hypothetical protein
MSYIWNSTSVLNKFGVAFLWDFSPKRIMK